MSWRNLLSKLERTSSANGRNARPDGQSCRWDLSIPHFAATFVFVFVLYLDLYPSIHHLLLCLLIFVFVYVSLSGMTFAFDDDEHLVVVSESVIRRLVTSVFSVFSRQYWENNRGTTHFCDQNIVKRRGCQSDLKILLPPSSST